MIEKEFLKDEKHTKIILLKNKELYSLIKSGLLTELRYINLPTIFIILYKSETKRNLIQWINVLYLQINDLQEKLTKTQKKGLMSFLEKFFEKQRYFNKKKIIYNLIISYDEEMLDIVNEIKDVINNQQLDT